MSAPRSQRTLAVVDVCCVPEADTVHNIELIIGYVDRSH